MDDFDVHPRVESLLNLSISGIVNADDGTVFCPDLCGIAQCGFTQKLMCHWVQDLFLLCEVLPGKADGIQKGRACFVEILNLWNIFQPLFNGIVFGSHDCQRPGLCVQMRFQRAKKKFLFQLRMGCQSGCKKLCLILDLAPAFGVWNGFFEVRELGIEYGVF